MRELIDTARNVAAQLVGHPVTVHEVGETTTGEKSFEVLCIVPTTKVTVTFNPNGKRIAVEWSSGQRGTNYKVCDVSDVITTAEEKAIP